MRSFASTLAILLLAAGISAVPSPDGTCGNLQAGDQKGFTCPQDLPCCSNHGYCGAEDAHCLTTAGCQAQFSNATASCYEPKAGETISPDGTCGTTGDGEFGYKCAGQECCSASGYCGTTTDHCAAASGCQPEFGRCA